MESPHQPQLKKKKGKLGSYVKKTGLALMTLLMMAKMCAPGDRSTSTPSGEQEVPTLSVTPPSNTTTTISLDEATANIPLNEIEKKDMERIKREFRSEYGIKLITDDFGRNDRIYHIPRISSEDFLAVTEHLKGELDKYPVHLQKEIKNLKIHLSGGLFTYKKGERKGEQREGLAGPGNIYLNAKSGKSGFLNFDETLHQEIFHRLDGTSVRDADDKIWKNNFPISDAAKLANEKNNDPNREKRTTLRGFAWDFTFNYDSMSELVMEDQAYIAGGIMTNATLRNYIQRGINGDTQLKEKIEMLTGCTISDTGKFSNTMSEEEYSEKFNTSGYEYYADRGEGQMDHTFWNNMLNI